MRVHHGVDAEAGQVRLVERVPAQHVVHKADGRVEVLVFFGKDVGVDEHHALVGGHAVGTPVEVVVRHGDAKAVLFEGGDVGIGQGEDQRLRGIDVGFVEDFRVRGDGKGFEH